MGQVFLGMQVRDWLIFGSALFSLVAMVEAYMTRGRIEAIYDLCRANMVHPELVKSHGLPPAQKAPLEKPSAV